MRPRASVAGHPIHAILSPFPVSERSSRVSQVAVDGESRSEAWMHGSPNLAGLAAHSMLALRHPRSDLGTGQGSPP
jgi:hypothetical protein